MHTSSVFTVLVESGEGQSRGIQQPRHDQQQNHVDDVVVIMEFDRGCCCVWVVLKIKAQN